MNRLKIIVLAGMGALDLAAAAFAWRSFTSVTASDDLPARSARLVTQVLPAVENAAPQGDDRETLTRPLFEKSRRPAQAGAHGIGKTVGAAPPPAGLKLLAVIGFSQSSRVFVTWNANAEGKWLRVGETLENWSVDSITAQEMSLRQNDDRVRLGLFYDNSTPPVAAKPEPPPPPRPDVGDETPPAKVVAPEAFGAVRNAKRGGH